MNKNLYDDVRVWRTLGLLLLFAILLIGIGFIGVIESHNRLIEIIERYRAACPFVYE